MNFLVDNQVASILISFTVGSIIAGLIYRHAQSSLSWKVADFIWVALGGVGAVAALLSGSYQDERGRVDRQIDISYATTKTFETNTSRFLLLHCKTDRQGPLYRPATLALCAKTKALTASAEANANLPLFLDVAQTRTPLSSISWVLGGQAEAVKITGMSMSSVMDMVHGFDVQSLQTLAAVDAPTSAAIATLDASPHADVAAEYQVIAASYEDLITQLGRVKSEWDYLEQNSIVLTLQVIALCLVAFAAPFRLGKSINDF